MILLFSYRHRENEHTIKISTPAMGEKGTLFCS